MLRNDDDETGIYGPIANSLGLGVSRPPTSGHHRADKDMQAAVAAAFGAPRPKAGLGEQAERLGETRLWVLPNPSGLNANYSRADLAALFRALREASEADG